MPRMIATSMLAADFAELKTAVELVNRSEADWFHLDVMDGVFVPNISYGIPVVQAIKKHAEKPLDTHLMIVQPERYFDAFKKAGAAILTIHYEASIHLNRSLQRIAQLGMRAGVALNPHTPVSLLADSIADVDVLLLMSVNPGFGGQRFIENTYAKIEKAKDLIRRKNAKTLIEVDGGVHAQHAAALFAAGADILVAGTAVFRSADPTRSIAELKNASIDPSTTYDI
ncbi:MAG: ribulose-phosphate 3-epimerase [Flavobacteriales bacterium]